MRISDNLLPVGYGYLTVFFVFNTTWVYIPCKNLCTNIIEGQLYRHWIYNSENPYFDNEKDIHASSENYEESGYRRKSGFPFISHSLRCVSYPTRSVCREKVVHLRPDLPYSTRTPVHKLLNQQKDKSSRLFPKRQNLQSRTENCSKWNRLLAIVLTKDNCHTTDHTANWQFQFRDLYPNAKRQHEQRTIECLI